MKVSERKVVSIKKNGYDGMAMEGWPGLHGFHARGSVYERGGFCMDA